MSKSNTPNNKKIFIECAQNKRYTSSMCEHLQCVNNHYAKFEYKGMKTSVVTEYTNQTPSTHFGWKCLSSTSLKNEKIFMKCAQDEGARLQYVNNHYAKFE